MTAARASRQSEAAQLAAKADHSPVTMERIRWREPSLSELSVAEKYL